MPLLTPQTLPPSMRREHGHRDAEKGSRAGLRGLLSYKPYQNVLILYGRTSIISWPAPPPPSRRPAPRDPCSCLEYRQPAEIVAGAANPDSTVNNAVMFSWEAVFPLFAFTRKGLGGLELSVSQDVGDLPVNAERWAHGPSPSDSNDRCCPSVVGGAVYFHDGCCVSNASQSVARASVSQAVYVQRPVQQRLRPLRPRRPESVFRLGPGSPTHLGTDHAHNRRPTRVPARRALLPSVVGTASCRHWLFGSGSLGSTRRSDDRPQNGRFRRYVSTSLALCTLPWPDPL